MILNSEDINDEVFYTQSCDFCYYRISGYHLKNLKKMLFYVESEVTFDYLFMK